jgi:hypothetical protein
VLGEARPARDPVHLPPWAEGLPEEAGVYRFLDDRGDVLYVGKARSLRARIRTYFTGSDRRRLHEQLMERAAGLRVETTGSEAEALLREAEAIREESPPYNVVRDVGRRRGRPGDAVLFLPGAEGGVLAIVLAAGRVAGRVEIGAGRRGVGRLDDLIRRHVLGRERPEDDRGDAALLATWLRRERDRVSVLDLSMTTSATAARRLVRAYLDDPDLLRDAVFHRD